MQMSFIELMDISLAVKRLLYEVNYGYIFNIRDSFQRKNAEYAAKAAHASSADNATNATNAGKNLATLFVGIVSVLPHNGVIKC